MSRRASCGRPGGRGSPSSATCRWPLSSRSAADTPCSSTTTSTPCPWPNGCSVPGAARPHWSRWPSAPASGRGAPSLVTVPMGTGLGAGLILDGRLVRGHIQIAGEIGHMSVSLDGPTCVCGGIGCLATYVAGGMITGPGREGVGADRARERLASYPTSPLLTRAGGDPARIGAPLLFQAAAEGDPLAHAVVDDACEAPAGRLRGGGRTLLTARR